MQQEYTDKHTFLKQQLEAKQMEYADKHSFTTQELQDVFARLSEETAAIAEKNLEKRWAVLEDAFLKLQAEHEELQARHPSRPAIDNEDEKKKAEKTLHSKRKQKLVKFEEEGEEEKMMLEDIWPHNSSGRALPQRPLKHQRLSTSSGRESRAADQVTTDDRDMKETLDELFDLPAPRSSRRRR